MDFKLGNGKYAVGATEESSRLGPCNGEHKLFINMQTSVNGYDARITINENAIAALTKNTDSGIGKNRQAIATNELANAGVRDAFALLMAKILPNIKTAVSTKVNATYVDDQLRTNHEANALILAAVNTSTHALMATFAAQVTEQAVAHAAALASISAQLQEQAAAYDAKLLSKLDAQAKDFEEKLATALEERRLKRAAIATAAPTEGTASTTPPAFDDQDTVTAATGITAPDGGSVSVSTTLKSGNVGIGPADDAKGSTGGSGEALSEVIDGNAATGTGPNNGAVVGVPIVLVLLAGIIGAVWWIRRTRLLNEAAKTEMVMAELGQGAQAMEMVANPISRPVAAGGGIGINNAVYESQPSPPIPVPARACGSAGGGVVASAGKTTCSYASANGNCKKPSKGGFSTCTGHTCTVGGCHGSKASKATKCTNSTCPVPKNPKKEEEGAPEYLEPVPVGADYEYGSAVAEGRGGTGCAALYVDPNNAAAADYGALYVEPNAKPILPAAAAAADTAAATVNELVYEMPDAEHLAFHAGVAKAAATSAAAAAAVEYLDPVVVGADYEYGSVGEAPMCTSNRTRCLVVPLTTVMQMLDPLLVGFSDFGGVSF
jgi:hypothetical protein